MVCARLEFPLGMYHARSSQGGRPEWVPSPVRLIGALLAASSELPTDEPEADRAVLQRLCEAAPPIIYAPRSAPFQEQIDEMPAAVAELRGPSRWAPRNPSTSEQKKDLPGMRTVNVAEIDKGGVAIGDLPVLINWPDLELESDDRARLRRLVGEVAWLGTSRTPVVCRLVERPEAEEVPSQTLRWAPLVDWDDRDADASIRIPSPTLLSDFDQVFAARRATKDRVESAAHIPPPVVERWPYEISDPGREAEALEPRHWGRLAIVELDPESEMVPRAAGAYLVARAFRAALMDAFAERGAAGEAPQLLHGHGACPHLALLPLPFAGRRHGDGRVMGFGLLYPHPDRAPEVAAESRLIEATLEGFFPDAKQRRPIRVPGAGSFLIRAPKPAPSLTLSRHRYVGPARRWATVTPVVHSRWRKGEDEAALAAQVSADCEHVGLSAPCRIERLRCSALQGGGNRIIPDVGRLRPEWRSSLQGPRSHLLIEFDREVVGPVALGKARHFGLGLCVPCEWAKADG